MADNPLIRFLNNIRYLFRYDLKQMNKFSNADFYVGLVERIKYETKAEFEEICIPDIKNSFETLEELLKTEKSIIRFGDGELLLMNGEGIPFQEYDEKLANMLKEIFYNDDENLLTGAPYFFYHSLKNCRPHVVEYSLSETSKHCHTLEKYVNKNKTYYDVGVSQVYPTYVEYDFEKHFNMLKSIWNNKKVTIIVGDRVFDKVEYNIFDNAQVNYIYGPTKHAFREYDSLKEKIMQVPKENILIFVLGPCGKALAYEMHKLGYRTLDMGHALKDYDAYKKSVKMTIKKSEEFFKPD